MKRALTALAIVLPFATPAVAEEPLALFEKAVTGSWAKMAAAPFADFDAETALTAMRQCDSSAPTMVTYELREKRLFRSEGTDATIVLDAKQGSERRGFRQWLVLRTDGPKMLLRGSTKLSDETIDIIMTDDGSYVRCPKKASD